MNNNSMTVITSKPFGSLNVDVYEDSKHEYYMTREQIGQALEYKNPSIAIGKIHNQNKDRLDPLSSLSETDNEVGNYTQKRHIYMYSLRGVMEICRFSRQPKADKFIDFCWDVMESLMRGDSVLASPKMDAALTPDFIQAQFVTLMEKQADLDKKMKYLNDRMGRVFDKVEDTRGLVNETLATVSSVSTAVQKIKEKQADDSIRSKSYTPRAEQISDWRRDMYDKIKIVAKINDMKVEEVMSKIYLYMRDVYGFVIEDERKKFKQKTGRSGHISTIDVVESSDMYKSIFESLVKDLHAEAINSKKENFFDPPKAIEAAPVVEVEAKEIDTELSAKEVSHKKKSDAARWLVPVIEPLAIKMNDKSVHYHKTYRMVYNEIGSSKMRRMLKAYSRVHGRNPVPKTKVFLESDSAMRLFKKTVEKLMKEVEEN